VTKECRTIDLEVLARETFQIRNVVLQHILMIPPPTGKKKAHTHIPYPPAPKRAHETAPSPPTAPPHSSPAPPSPPRRPKACCSPPPPPDTSRCRHHHTENNRKSPPWRARSSHRPRSVRCGAPCWPASRRCGTASRNSPSAAARWCGARRSAGRSR
jgi:hypothetical protein